MLLRPFLYGVLVLGAFASIAKGDDYIGCYKDTLDRDLDGILKAYFFTNTLQECISMCKAEGFSYASVQVRYECFCGDSYGKHGSLPESNCSMACPGDQSQTCGGLWANAVYRASYSGTSTSSTAVITSTQNVSQAGTQTNKSTSATTTTYPFTTREKQAVNDQTPTTQKSSTSKWQDSTQISNTTIEKGKTSARLSTSTIKGQDATHSPSGTTEKGFAPTTLSTTKGQNVTQIPHTSIEKGLMSTTEGQNATQMPPAVTEKELIPANHYPATTEKAVTPYQSSLTSNVQAATPYYHSTSQSTVTPNSTTSKSITTTKTVAKPIYIVTCQCSSGAFANMTSTQIVHELVANTTIDVRKTSSKQRRYYSANDSRPSSQNVGCVGICILVVISGMIVVPDLISLIKHLCGKT